MTQPTTCEKPFWKAQSTFEERWVESDQSRNHQMAPG